MNFANLRTWAGPLIILAFVGCAVNHLNTIFTSSSRWTFLVLSFVLLLGNWGWIRLFNTRFGIGTLGFVFWNISTYFWSEVPQLTLMKSIALALVVVTGMGGGAYWVKKKPLKSCLDCLAPMTIVSIFAGLFGSVIDPDNAWNASELALYNGLSGNSNMMGIMAAMSLPYPVWHLFLNWSQRAARLRWGVVVGILVGLLLMSGSRSSILAGICIACGFMSAMSLTKVMTWIVLISTLSIVSILVFPQLSEQFESRFIYKRYSSDDDELISRGAFASRDETWETSYEQATKGGIVGGGYGVTINESGFDGSLSTANYGREKGNSQLGIMEESGIIGLLIYVFSTWTLFASLWAMKKRCRNREMRVLLGIVIGSLLGMIVNSMFEAWYGAPGSSQCAYYWVLAGVGISLVNDRRVKNLIKYQIKSI